MQIASSSAPFHPSPSLHPTSVTSPPPRHQMEPVISTICSTPACEPVHTSLSLSLLPDIRSKAVICTHPSACSFHLPHPSIPPCMLCFTLPVVSPLFLPPLSLLPSPSAGYYVQPLSTLILLLQSIHLSSFTSLCTSTSLTSRQSRLLSAPLPPSILSLTLAHALTRQDPTHIPTPDLSSIWTNYLNSQWRKRDVAVFKREGNL